MSQQQDSNKARLELYAVGLALGLGLLLLISFVGEQRTDFEDAAAMGAQTTVVMATYKGDPIHCSDQRDAQSCIDAARRRGATNSALWLGNSQLHAINQARPGDVSGARVLFDRMADYGLDLVTFSQPNANLQEHLILFEYLRTQLPIKLVLLPLVFDDTREDGIRAGILPLVKAALAASPAANTSIGHKLVRTASEVSESNDTAGISDTVQERVERYLNLQLEKASSLWSARAELRGRIMRRLYILRNTVFGITPNSKRKVIRSRYQDNMAALAAILNSAKAADIKVIMYVAPLRRDVEIPYVEDEYAQFKREAQALAKITGAVYADLEPIVPTQLWGSKDATSASGQPEIDFMHFQAGGHQILASQLAELVPAVVGRKVQQ